MWAPATTTPSLLSNLLSAILLFASEVAATRQGRVVSNLFGVLGHEACSSSDESADGPMVGGSMWWVDITQFIPGWSVL